VSPTIPSEVAPPARPAPGASLPRTTSRRGREADAGKAAAAPRSDEFIDVGPLLAPRSVAVIGASDAGNLGGLAVGFLRRFGFPGAIHPINPGHETVAGLPCLPRVADLPEPVDLAIVAVGGDRVAGVVRECAAIGIPSGVVWAGDFGEAGAAGRARQDELIAICRESGFRLLGPNCLGAINGALPMTATFAPS
jgi:acetate---CoA ligase (ADP-forming)